MPRVHDDVTEVTVRAETNESSGIRLSRQIMSDLQASIACKIRVIRVSYISWFVLQVLCVVDRNEN